MYFYTSALLHFLWREAFHFHQGRIDKTKIHSSVSIRNGAIRDICMSRTKSLNNSHEIEVHNHLNM